MVSPAGSGRALGLRGVPGVARNCPGARGAGVTVPGQLAALSAGSLPASEPLPGPASRAAGTGFNVFPRNLHNFMEGEGEKRGGRCGEFAASSPPLL